MIVRAMPRIGLHDYRRCNPSLQASKTPHWKRISCRFRLPSFLRAEKPLCLKRSVNLSLLFCRLCAHPLTFERISITCFQLSLANVLITSEEFLFRRTHFLEIRLLFHVLISARWIIMENATEFLWGHRSLKNDIFIKSPGQSDKRKESSHTYASFGDKGTTVSINAYGHIMQMSCFLGFGASGFLCVDSQLPEPYYVQSRMEELLSSSQDPNRGLRLGLVDWSKYHALSSGFMYDRWPRCL